MRKSFGTVVAAGVLCLFASSALAQFPPLTDPTKDEAKCETAAGKALVKFVGSKSKCSSKCIVAARKTSGPYTSCFAPYADPLTQACIYDPLKGAAAKARAAIVKACAIDCPECFTAQDANLCTTGDPLVSSSDTQTNAFGPLLACVEFGGGTPAAAEAKCEDATAKGLTKFVGAKSKCYQKCNQKMLKGLIAPGSCDPPTPSDPATQFCIFDSLKGAEAKAVAAIDKVCGVAGATPACYNGFTGATWVGLVEAAIDASTPNVACGG